MKRETEVKRKLRQVIFRHLKKAVEDTLTPLPSSCLHNRVLTRSDGSEIGVCGFPRSTLKPGFPRDREFLSADEAEVICDASIPKGLARARVCPMWEPLFTRSEAKAVFKSDFAALIDQGRPAVALHYPDVAALMWVLDEADEEDVLGDVDALLADPDPVNLAVAPSPENPLQKALQ